VTGRRSRRYGSFAGDTLNGARVTFNEGPAGVDGSAAGAAEAGVGAPELGAGVGAAGGGVAVGV
jgi:hypothetical protein